MEPAAASHPASVFTLAPNLPFVDALAAGLWEQAGGDALALNRFTVLLPTARAVRSLREAFLRLSDGRPILLPRMAPLGDFATLIIPANEERMMAIEAAALLA